MIFVIGLLIPAKAYNDAAWNLDLDHASDLDWFIRWLLHILNQGQ